MGVTSRPSSKLFVLTGAPGSGKTEILRRVGDGITVVEEPARAILAEQRASGGRGTWDQDVALFVRLLLERAVDDHRRATAQRGTFVFDRGIPDCIVYAMFAELDAGSSTDAATAFRYEGDVLFLEPWREIYVTDDERTIDFDGAATFGEALRETYLRCGYRIVDVPRGSIDERVAFVRTAIGAER